MANVERHIVAAMEEAERRPMTLDLKDDFDLVRTASLFSLSAKRLIWRW